MGVIVAADTFREVVEEKALVSSGFAATRSAVEACLEEILGPFDPTGYGIVSDYPMLQMSCYAERFTWYRVRWRGRELVIAAIERPGE